MFLGFWLLQRKYMGRGVERAQRTFPSMHLCRRQLEFFYSHLQAEKRCPASPALLHPKETGSGRPGSNSLRAGLSKPSGHWPAWLRTRAEREVTLLRLSAGSTVGTWTVSSHCLLSAEPPFPPTQDQPGSLQRCSSVSETGEGGTVAVLPLLAEVLGSPE